MDICQGVLIAGMCIANVMSWFLAERKTTFYYATCCQLAGEDSFSSCLRFDYSYSGIQKEPVKDPRQ